MRQLALSFLGVGYLRPAPGTWGSLAAFLPAWALYQIGGAIALLLASIALGVAGVILIRDETAGQPDEDPGWIVLDEVVGQWIALLPVAIGASRAEVSPLELWPGLITAFLAFRLFDIWKPWLVGRADRRGDAVGVMLDDVWAGIFAAVIVVLLAALAHAGFVNAVPDQL